MKTDIITVHGDLDGRNEAMEAAERFAAYHGIAGKDAMHIRLLTEEAVGMIDGIMEGFTGKFWVESEKTKKGLLCRICLAADKQANRAQEAHILSVSSSGKNENAKGIRGKIRDLFRRSLQTATEKDEQFLLNMSDALGSPGSRSGSVTQDANYWSLQVYRQQIKAKQDDQPEEWDELEKSIISQLSDDVKVWLSNDSTELMIEKTIVC